MASSKKYWNERTIQGHTWERALTGSAPDLGDVSVMPGTDLALQLTEHAKAGNGQTCFWGLGVGDYATKEEPSIVGRYIQSNEDERTVRLTVKLPDWHDRLYWYKRDLTFPENAEASRLDMCAIMEIPYTLLAPVTMSLDIGDGTWWRIPAPVSTGGTGKVNPKTGRPGKRYEDGRKQHQSRRLQYAQKMAMAHAVSTRRHRVARTPAA